MADRTVNHHTVCVDIHTGTIHPVMGIQSVRQFFNLINIAGAWKKSFHFLQCDNIRIANRIRNTIKINPTIQTATVLNVICCEFDHSSKAGNL